MKKHVLIATGAALLSTSAFATKARMTALGQDSTRGSQYIQDSRNKFRNSAHVNNMNNYIVTEWETATNEAEGGFFRSTGNLGYGLYLGSRRDNGLRALDATGTPSAVTAYNPGNELDAFIAGDAGIQWGARLNYQNGEHEVNQEKRNAFGLGLGILMGDLSAYTNLSIAAKAEDTTGATNTEVKGKLGINVGAAYNWNNLTFHADYVSNKAEKTVTGATATGEFSYSDINVGVAQTHEISSTAMVFFAGDFSAKKWENTNLDATQGPTTNSARELKSNTLKATMGFETDATSWLTWRGSISQNIFIGSTEVTVTPANAALNGKKVTTADSTTVAAGASLTFGKLVVDGTLGANGNGELRLDEGFANVAVSYWF